MAATADDNTDLVRLTRLIDARHVCISIVTHDEAHALELVRQLAMDKGWDLSVWSGTAPVRLAIMEPPCAYSSLKIMNC